MALGTYDTIMILLVVLGVVFVAVYTQDNTQNVVGFETSLSRADARENYSLCDDIDCERLEEQLQDMALRTTTTVTTTTIKLNVFNTSGAFSSVLSSGDTNVLVDCGNSPGIMDMLFFNGIERLSFTFITRLDHEHAAGCSRMFLMIPHGMVYDSGVGVDDQWYYNYVFTTSDFRYVVSEKSVIDSSGIYCVIDRYNDGLTLLFELNGTRIYFGGDCAVLEEGFKADVLVCDNVISEDMLLSIDPKFYIMDASNKTFAGLGTKYGVKVFTPRDYDVLSIIYDGKNLRHSVKK